MSSNHVIRRTLIFLLCTTATSISVKSIKAEKSKAESQGCAINLKTGMHKDRPPMVIDLSPSANYLYPVTSDPSSLVFKHGESIGIFCPGRSNRESSAVAEPAVVLYRDKELQPIPGPERITCESGRTFQLAGRRLNISELSCQERPRASYSAILREHATAPECRNGRRYEIGYDLGGGRFLRTIELCHDKVAARTLWAHAKIEPADQGSGRYSGNRKNFKSGILFEDVNMSRDDPYSLSEVYKTVDEILGTPGAVDKYLSNKISERKFLAKGHLIASADKLYKSEQDSTMFYANVVPMWQQVNANPGNWFGVEEYVRQLASHKKCELDVWAGGVGVLKLDGKEIHLHRKPKSLEFKIPVPKVIYKCVVDKRAKQGLCLLVVNNPYAGRAELERSNGEYRLCRKLDACDRIGFKNDQPDRGYFYCCELADFYAKNRKELGLDELEAYQGYGKLELVKMGKLHEPIAWTSKDSEKKRSMEKAPPVQNGTVEE